MNKEKNQSLLSLTSYPEPPSSYYSKYSRSEQIPVVTLATTGSSGRASDVSSSNSSVVHGGTTENYEELEHYENLNTMAQGGQSVIVPTASVLLQQAASSHIVKSPYSHRDMLQNESINETPMVDYSVNMCDMNSHHFSGNSGTLICKICGDRATGKHYGAYSCDGCKGFFRRSVRKNHNYNCRFNRSCIVNKHKRNQCRFCRFRKCVAQGMKKEAVQNERDRISQRRVSFEETSNGISVSILLKAESQFKKPQQINLAKIKAMKIAVVDDVCESMKEQLIALVNWAQDIPTFVKFSQSDKLAMLRSRAGEHLLLGAAWRSLAMDDVLLLGNECIIPGNSSGMCMFPFPNIDPEINRIGRRVMNELVRTFRETNMDETEFVCLKAIVFFDPSIRGLHDIEEVKSIRYRVQLILEEYINDRPLEARGRFGQLLLALQVLQSIAWQMVEQIQFAELFGSTKVDSLLAEMLLGDFSLSPKELPDQDKCDSKDSSVNEEEMCDFASTIGMCDPLIKKDETLLSYLPAEGKKEEISPSMSSYHCSNTQHTDNKDYIDKFLKQEIVDPVDIN